MKGSLESFSVVSVPFPFTDRERSKRRPALILSRDIHFNRVIGHSVLAMITSAKNSDWPFDIEIQDLKQAGLPAPSVVRMKLFTLDHRLLIADLGKLSARDSASVRESLQRLLGLSQPV